MLFRILVADQKGEKYAFFQDFNGLFLFVKEHILRIIYFRLQHSEQPRVQYSTSRYRAPADESHQEAFVIGVLRCVGMVT